MRHAYLLKTIQVIIEMLSALNPKTCILFDDYSYAFDTPNHAKLFEVMLDIDFPPNPVAILKVSTLLTQLPFGEMTFKIGKSVGQGCIVSLILFTLYTEQAVREANIDYFSIATGGRQISDLR